MKNYLSISLHINCMVVQGGGHYTKCQWMKKNVMVNEIACFVISSEWNFKCVVGFGWIRVHQDGFVIFKPLVQKFIKYWTIFSPKKKKKLN
jgi:hypothetical protein